MAGENLSDFWEDRRVFVTGATGLVGSWLVRRLLAATADVVPGAGGWVSSASWCAPVIDHVRGCAW